MHKATAAKVSQNTIDNFSISFLFNNMTILCAMKPYDSYA